jgi:predicted O-methyltransferase YrrM
MIEGDTPRSESAGSVFSSPSLDDLWLLTADALKRKARSVKLQRIQGQDASPARAAIAANHRSTDAGGTPPMNSMRLINALRRRWWTYARIAPFHARHREQPCPLNKCLRLLERARLALSHADPLKPKSVIRKGRHLQDPELAIRLQDEDFGGWSPQIEAVDWLIRLLVKDKPRRVLEFGSGRTTVCLSVILTRLHGPDGFRLLSLDQDTENVERASKRLAGLPGLPSCRIVHVPLIPAAIDEQQTSVYDLNDVDPQHFAWLGQADFVFVDGPYAKGPCRYGTLPKVISHVRVGARFVLDDALRDKELLTGALWARDGLKVEGIVTIGQGFMIGRA